MERSALEQGSISTAEPQQEDTAALQEKYERGILPMIQLLCPDDVPLEQYEVQVMEDLLDGIKKKQVAQNRPLENPSVTLQEAEEMLVARMKALIKDNEELTEKDKNTEEHRASARRAKMALLYRKDAEAVEDFERGSEGKDMTWGFCRYLNISSHRKERLTERELESIAQMGYGKQLIKSSMRDFELRTTQIPESILLKGVFSVDDTDVYYNTKKSLERAPEQHYSRALFEKLISVGFGKEVFEAFNKFKDVDFEDAAMAARNLHNRMPAVEMVTALMHQVPNHESNEFKQKLDTAVMHQHIAREDRECESFKKHYRDIFKMEDAIYRYTQGDQGNYELGEEKSIIEQGYLGMFTANRGYIEYLVEHHYDWLLGVVQQHNQEHLLLSVPRGKEQLLHPEDSLNYAKRLLRERPYLIKPMANMFGEYVFDQEVYDYINQHTNVDEGTYSPARFQNLNEQAFEKFLTTLPSRPGHYFAKDVLAFDLSASEKFQDYHEYARLIREVNALFGEGMAPELYGDLRLIPKEVFAKTIEVVLEEVRQKAEIVTTFCDTKGRDKREFIDKYKFLLELSSHDLGALIGEIEWMPDTNYQKVYVNGLRYFAALTEEKKREAAEDLGRIKTVYPQPYEYNELFGRYFSIQNDKPSDQNLKVVMTDFPNYVRKYDVMDKDNKKFWQTLIPWSEGLGKIAAIQKQATRDEFNPWRTHLIPLIEKAADSNILSLEQRDDGMHLYEYVSRFGMYDMPLMFKLFLDIQRCPSIDVMDDSLKEKLRVSFGIDAEKVCRKDKKNMGLILSELEKIGERVVRGIMEEDLDAIERIAASDYTLELFNAMKGNSGFGQSAGSQTLLKEYGETQKKYPEKFKLLPGYIPVEVSIPELRASVTVEAEYELEKILRNTELQTTLDTYAQLIVAAEQPFDSAAFRSESLNTFRVKIDEIDQRLAAEEAKESPNEKALIGLKKKKETAFHSLEQFESAFAAQKSMTEPGMLIEMVHAFMPAEWEGKKELLMRFSLQDMAQRMPEGYRNFSEHFSDIGTGEKVERSAEFITNYIREHYLNKKHGQEEAIQTNNKEILKALRKHWGVQDFEKSILAVSNEKMKSLSRGEVLQSTRSLTLIPSKGIQRVITGDLGKACTSGRGYELAQGKYEGVTSYSLVIDKGTKQQRFVGSFLVVETKTDSKEPILILRANNPQQNLFSMMDGDALIESIIDEVKALAKRRNIAHIAVPLDASSAASSNRPEVSEYYQEHFKDNTKVGLVDTPDTNFNGYAIWNKTGGCAVAKI
jgi:hypothetical protein